MPEPARVCTACARALESGAAPAACLRCQNLYHQECWDPLSHCLAFGCAGTPKELVGDLDKQPPPRACPSCKHENPASARLCLSCGQKLVELPAQEIFTSAAGWQAPGPDELIGELDRHWETGVQHLYNGDLETWLADRRPELAEVARATRKGQPQHSVGLETFLQATGLVKFPTLEVSPHELDLEGPGATASASVEIRNAGRGYLSGTAKADQPWIEIEPHEFAGNRTRMMVVARLPEVPAGGGDATLELATSGGPFEVVVRARRIGVEAAVALFKAGDTVRARAMCRKLLEAHSSNADAAVLTAACYLEEDNPSSAVHSLRNLAGACQALPPYVVERVYRWLQDGDPAASGIERVEIYEAMIPCSEGPLGVELRRHLAGAAMERARLAAAAFRTGGTSLWQGRTATSEDVVELLQMAAAYDPSLASEAAALQKQMRSGVSRGKLMMNLGLLVLLGALIAAVVGSFAWTRYVAARQESEAKAAYDAGQFQESADKYRTLMENSPETSLYRVQLALSLAKLAQANAGELDRSHALMTQAAELSVGNPEVQGALAGLLVDWAEELEKAGKGGEARIRLEQALQLDSGNTRAQSVLSRVKSDTDLYWSAFQLADSDLGRQPLDNYKTLAAVSQRVEELAGLGMKPYDSRMMVAFADVTGDGNKDLIVAGSGNGGAEAVGEWAVYELKGSRLQETRTGKVPKTPFLTRVTARDLSGNDRADLILGWLAAGSEGAGATLLVANKAGRFLEEPVPSDLPVEVMDRNADGRAEIWIPEVVAESTGLGDRVLMYQPFLWNEPGFTKAEGDYSQYYRDYIGSLKQQMENNPYPAGDANFEKYRQDRLKGIGLAERLLGAP